MDNDDERSSILNISQKDSVTPKFRGQTTISTPGKHVLDDNGNCVLILHDALSLDEMKKYLSKAALVTRTTGPSVYGHTKPRREVCYSPTGESYVYSRISHPTDKFPKHVLRVLKVFNEYIDDILDNPFRELSNAVDIIYDSQHPRGGGISAHSDDEDEWGMVMIYSLGQTRWLRIRDKITKKYMNVKLLHNSLVVMYGNTFQSSHTHQVDKLSLRDVVYSRLSLNVRYK